MSTIGERIAQLRNHRGMTQSELGDAIGETKQTIYKYEHGIVTNIPLAKIEAIAAVLRCPPTVLTGWTDTPVQPAPTVSRTIDPIYDALNKDGQKELCRYGRYLTTLDEYRREEAAPQIEYIRHYLTAAAAGYAAPIEGEDYELIPRGPSVPANADFCIDITGDSMEPYIHNGETVYVKREAELKEFEPGIFFVDGDVFCKQWAPGYAGETYLLSANPKRQDANITISRDSGRHCAYFGKVLLKKKLPPPEYF